MIDFDLVLDYLGHLGKFQWYVILLACIAQLFGGIQIPSSIFFDKLFVNNLRCHIPHCDNESTVYDEYFVNFAIPNVTDDFGEVSISQCQRFATIRGQSYCGVNAFNRSSIVDCSSYVWDNSEFEETAISEFNVICKKSWGGASSNTIFMCGVLLGSAGFGIVADKFGRKNVMMSASLVMLVSSIGTSFSPNLSVFSFLRFITAASVSGLFQTGYVLAIEYIGTSKRILCANIMQIVFAIGELVLSLVAFFIKKWRVLELVISVPAVVLLVYYWLLPESVRWLISKGKHTKAKQAILKAARWNGATVPENLLQAAEYRNIDSESYTVEESTGPLSLVKTPRLRKWSINIFFCWIVNSMVFYGLSLSVGKLSGSIYKNFALLALAEIPAVMLATWALIKCGRRYVLCSVMVFGGLACGATVFVPTYLAWITVILAVLGKSAIAASFAIIYIYTAEIYPTVVRSTGIGLSSMFGRFGSIIAPFINELRKVYYPLPMIVFSIATILSGISALALPETHNQQLPETVEEAESFGLSSGFERMLSRPRNLNFIANPSNIPRRILEEERRRLIT